MLSTHLEQTAASNDGPAIARGLSRASGRLLHYLLQSPLADSPVLPDDADCIVSDVELFKLIEVTSLGRERLLRNIF